MIITISGSLGSGKSTVAKLLAKKLGYKHYSMGDFQRELAKERGISLLELSKLEEKDKSLDKIVDQKQKDLGKKEDKFVIDSRLGFHFIPHSVKVFLDVDEKESAKRIFNHLRPGEKENATLEKTEENIRIRKQSEQKRYQEYYNLNLHDKANYDFVLDTTNISAEEVIQEILKHIGKL